MKINVTNSAKLYLIDLLSKQKIGTKIKIFINNPGLPNAECGLAYYIPKLKNLDDIEIKFDKLSIFFNKKISYYLKDAEIDLINENINYTLTIKAPNAKKKLISVNREKKYFNKTRLFNRIKKFLSSEINPYLQNHGGYVSLIEVTENKSVILEFHGGCNGCSMAYFTLKEKIEKDLIKKIPEIKCVLDITEHVHGEHSFF